MLRRCSNRFKMWRRSHVNPTTPCARSKIVNEARFRPFIWIVTEDGTHSFLTAIAERQLKVLRLPDGFEHLSEPAKLEAVLHRVREHYQKTTRKYIGFGHPQVPLRSRLRPQHRSGHRR